MTIEQLINELIENFDTFIPTAGYSVDYVALRAFLSERLAKLHGQWIPITERLPTMAGYYLVCEMNERRPGVEFAFFTPDAQVRYDWQSAWQIATQDDRMYIHPSHWMPLPPLPAPKLLSSRTT